MEKRRTEKITPPVTVLYRYTLKPSLHSFTRGVSDSTLFLARLGPRFLLFSPKRMERMESKVKETNVKCKWKFIALGDRRRFLTFKYFINFFFSAWLGRPSRQFFLREPSFRVSRLAGFCRFFSPEIYCNVIKTFKWLWIAARVITLNPTLISLVSHTSCACVVATRITPKNQRRPSLGDRLLPQSKFPL